jgi:hypothetical protein
MHTRRLAAFLIGGWLLCTLLMAFMTSQSLVNVDRIMADPPQGLSRPEHQRIELTYAARQFNRHVTEAWQVMQFGIAAALLATSCFTPHRSRVLIAGALALAVIVAVLYFWLTPALTQAERTFDFRPAGADLAAQERHLSLSSWSKVLEILKFAIASLVAARLVFDRSGWKTNSAGSPALALAAGRTRRRRRVGSNQVVSKQIDAVDDTDNGHVDR